jgi:segregation and condensation protein A
VTTVAIPVEAEPPAVVPIGGPGFEVHLEVFSGPFGLLLNLIESRQLDILTVPLAEVADAYVAHLASQPVDPAHLSEFVAVAAQLIYLKSRRLLPGDPVPPLPDGDDEPDEEELRRRVIEYRAMRDAALGLAERDGRTPAIRREPREADLPEAPVEALAPRVLADALERLAAIPEPEAPPPEVVPREVTIGQQIAMLREALANAGRMALQTILERCGSRMEATVTFMALLELVRRRQVRARQRDLFGPILLEAVTEARGGDG